MVTIKGNKELKVLVFDVESEDLNLVRNKPWQLAYNKWSPKSGIIEEHDLNLGWEDLRISAGAARVTGFTPHEWRAKAQDPKSVLLQFNKALEWADIVTGHNILKFDIPVYVSACRILNLEPVQLHNKAVDTLALLKAYKLDQSYQKGENFLAWQFKWINFLDRKIMKRGFATLSAGADLFEIHYDKNKLHDALYDIKLNLEVFSKLSWKFPI